MLDCFDFVLQINLCEVFGIYNSDLTGYSEICLGMPKVAKVKYLQYLRITDWIVLIFADIFYRSYNIETQFRFCGQVRPNNHVTAYDHALFTVLHCFFQEGIVMKRWHQLRGAGLCKVVKSRHEEGVNFNKNLVDVNWERFCKASNII